MRGFNGMLVQVDASGLEWRTLLQLTQDEVGIHEILSGEDVHSNNQNVFELPTRLISKRFLFRTIYRGSGWAFANDPDFTHVSSDPRFWDGMNEKFYTKYKGIDRKHKEWGELVLQGKPIEGPLGRSWSINLKRDVYGNLKLPWPTLTNYPNQGVGADVMLIARISAHKRIKESGITCNFIATVHDSIVVDTPKQNVQFVTDTFHQVFDDIPKNIWNVFKYDWIVPMGCEVKIGKNMKDMVKHAPNI